MLLSYYLNKLDYFNIPEFLKKYLCCPSLLRLKKVGYFCGMDYASKDIYQFSEYISRYDHSLTVALLTYKLTNDKVTTLAGLFHDIATPCFSHVIDYMNGDYESQESTEEYTETILKNDSYLMSCLLEDNIDVDEIINFKKYSIVDSDRPKLCTDRVDGIILTGIGWTKNITCDDIDKITDDLIIFKNEMGQDEIGFRTLDVARKVINVNESIDMYCHLKEDNYMMELLASITKLAIQRKYISYNDLYLYDEDYLINLFKTINDSELKKLMNIFETITLDDIPDINLDAVKVRTIKPFVNGKRIK